jgi:hypothetical protein
VTRRDAVGRQPATNNAHQRQARCLLSPYLADASADQRTVLHRRDPPVGAGGTRRVEADDPHVGPVDAGGLERELERSHQGVDRHIRAPRTRLGVSSRRSTRNLPAASITVALLDVPPLSRPTATHERELNPRDTTDPDPGARPPPQADAQRRALSGCSAWDATPPRASPSPVRRFAGSLPCSLQAAPTAAGRMYPTTGARKITRWRTWNRCSAGPNPGTRTRPPSRGCDGSTLSTAGVRVPTSMPVVIMPASSGFDGPAASSSGSNRTRLRYGTRPVPGTAPHLLPEALAAGRPHRRITCSRRAAGRRPVALGRVQVGASTSSALRRPPPTSLRRQPVGSGMKPMPRHDVRHASPARALHLVELLMT